MSECYHFNEVLCIFLFAAWIGSLGRSLVFFAGPVAAPLTEKFNCRIVTMVGAVTVAVGLTLTSFAKSIVFYYFTYGLIAGFGSSCIRTSSFLVVAKYFQKRKPFATGLLTAGAGLGMFTLAPLTQILLDNFGLDNTFRLLAGIAFVGGIPALTYDPNVEETDPQDSVATELEDENSEAVRTKDKLVDCSVWRVPTFSVFAVAFTMNALGRIVPIIHLVSYNGGSYLNNNYSKKSN